MFRSAWALPCLLCTLATPAAAEMTLDLPGVTDGTFSAAQVLSGFGCDGQNLSPELICSSAPAETKSFIVTVYDPDAPTGSGLWHWSAFDIPASTTRLDQGAAMPLGAVQARNDFSHNQYDGACPPKGSTHRYVISVFAMPIDRLPLDDTASAAMVGFFANSAALDRAVVEVSYGH